MNVAWLTDPDWMAHEPAIFRWTLVGLLDAGAVPLHVLPRGVSLGDLELAGAAVEYEESRFGWLRRRRVRALGETLGSRGVDLVHAFNARLHSSAMAVAEMLGAPLVCGCWSLAEVEAACRAPESVPTVYIAPTPPLADRCRGVVGDQSTVELHRPAVQIAQDTEPPLQPPLADPEAMLSCLIIAGDEAADVRLFEGIARVTDRLDQLMLFLYAPPRRQHRLWDLARELGFVERLNLAPDVPSRADVLVQADAILHPYGGGSVSGLVLEAMGAGRPILAAADDLLDYLQDHRTARLLDEPSPADWADVLVDLARNPARYRELGAAARRHVTTHHSPSESAERLMSIYRRLVDRGPLPFQAAPGRAAVN